MAYVSSTGDTIYFGSGVTAGSIATGTISADKLYRDPLRDTFQYEVAYDSNYAASVPYDRESGEMFRLYRYYVIAQPTSEEMEENVEADLVVPVTEKLCKSLEQAHAYMLRDIPEEYMPDFHRLTISCNPV